MKIYNNSRIKCQDKDKESHVIITVSFSEMKLCTDYAPKEYVIWSPLCLFFNNLYGILALYWFGDSYLGRTALNYSEHLKYFHRWMGRCTNWERRSESYFFSFPSKTRVKLFALQILSLGEEDERLWKKKENN